MSKRDWKIVAGTTTVIVFLFSALRVFYAPEYAPSPDNVPSVFHSAFAHWLMLIITSLPAFVYIALDWSNLFPKKQVGEEKGEGYSS